MLLHDCLALTPYATLWRISRHYGVPIGHDCRRAQLLARLRAAPLPIALRRDVATWDDRALEPLQALACASAPFERAAFERLFGPCIAPRHGPIPLDPPGPWLAARGAIFATATYVLLPDELRDAIPLPEDNPLPPVPSAPAWPLYDLAMLLILAQQSDLALNRRGELGETVVRTLLPRCAPGATAASLRFLADLAVRHTLLHPTDDRRLRTGPAMAGWPALDAAAQSRTLWQCWIAGPARRSRRRPRLGACGDCSWLREALSPLLSPSLGTDDGTINLTAYDLAALWSELPCARAAGCPVGTPTQAKGAAYPATTAARMLLAGPLSWLSLCRVSIAADGSALAVGLTAWGRVLWQEALPPPVALPAWSYDDTRASEHGQGNETLLFLAVAYDSPTESLLRLAEIATPLTASTPCRGLWRIEPSLVEVWTRAGWRLEELYALLERHTQMPLPAHWRHELARLAEARAGVTLRTALVLESEKPLPRTQPPLSALVARTLSPRAAIVRPRRVPALRRALAQQGVAVHVVPNAATADGADSASGHGAVVAAVALDLLRALAARDFPVPPTSWWPRETETASSEAERDAVSLWRDRLLTHLDALLDGGTAAKQGAGEDNRVAPSSPPGVVSPLVRQTIARALEGEHSLRLRYAPADGRAAHWRHVDPQRLERQHGRDYLRAYCRWRRSERLFRLDRIEACDLVVTDEAGERPGQNT